VSFGVSALLRHYPGPDVTLAVLGVGEETIWPLVELFGRSMEESAVAS
jgi:hypothetical protein